MRVSRLCLFSTTRWEVSGPSATTTSSSSSSLDNFKYELSIGVQSFLSFSSFVRPVAICPTFSHFHVILFYFTFLIFFRDFNCPTYLQQTIVKIKKLANKIEPQRNSIPYLPCSLSDMKFNFRKHIEFINSMREKKKIEKDGGKKKSKQNVGSAKRVALNNGLFDRTLFCSHKFEF